MKQGFLKYALWLLLLLIPAGLLFSESGTAVIVYAEGDGFTLVRDSDSSFFEVAYDDVLGMLLYPGDTILTEEDTFLEIQVTSNASLIKIAENTTFAFEHIGNYGGGTLNVAYGRIRAKVNKLTNDDEFSVMGSGTTAGVRGTDFGYDLTYGQDISETESNEVITSVYCFEGSVKVEQESKENKDVKEVFILEDQMVVTSSVKDEAPLIVYDIEQEIEEFWEENKFVYQLIEEPVLVVSEDYDPDMYYTEKIFGQKRKLQRLGGGLSISGFVMASGGFAAYQLLDDRSVGIGLMSVGAASFISGMIFLMQSTTLPPPPEGWTPSEIQYNNE